MPTAWPPWCLAWGAGKDLPSVWATAWSSSTRHGPGDHQPPPHPPPPPAWQEGISRRPHTLSSAPQPKLQRPHQVWGRPPDSSAPSWEPGHAHPGRHSQSEGLSCPGSARPALLGSPSRGLWGVHPWEKAKATCEREGLTMCLPLARITGLRSLSLNIWKQLPCIFCLVLQLLSAGGHIWFLVNYPDWRKKSGPVFFIAE